MKTLRILISSLFLFAGAVMNAQLIFQEPPENFQPALEVACCHMQVGDKILFLKRNSHNGPIWGLPGGKLEPGESALQAVMRETKEETSLALESNHVTYFGKVYVRYPHVDFIYHMFGYKLENYPAQVIINPEEHLEYRWMTLQDAVKEPLIPGSQECFRLVFGKVSK